MKGEVSTIAVRGMKMGMDERAFGDRLEREGQRESAGHPSSRQVYCSPLTSSVRLGGGSLNSLGDLNGGGGSDKGEHGEGLHGEHGREI